jgi:hypothetical protein
VTTIISLNFCPTYHQITTLSSEKKDIQAETVVGSLDLKNLAQEFAADVPGREERKKKTLPARIGIQVSCCTFERHFSVN